MPNLRRNAYRKSGESLTLVMTLPHNYDYVSTVDTVIAFGGNNGNCPMDGGDMIWYACDDPNGILSVEKANGIYENLKSRYGMS